MVSTKDIVARMKQRSEATRQQLVREALEKAAGNDDGSTVITYRVSGTRVGRLQENFGRNACRSRRLANQANRVWTGGRRRFAIASRPRHSRAL